MSSIKSKEKIGIGLSLLAIVLMSINIYNQGAGIENRIIELCAWTSLIVSSFYMLRLSSEKKKLSDSDS